MIRYIPARTLSAEPALATSMFQDRATQFHDRLKWDVDVDADGCERDQYDTQNPLYVMWQNNDGSHGGSMRFLPTTGRTMVNEHFADLLDGEPLQDPLVWECSRFCLSPNAEPRVAAALMLAGGEILQRFCLTHFVGVFDMRIQRIYRRIGASPKVLGTSGQGSSQIGVGVWTFTPDALARVSEAAKITPEQSARWFVQSFEARAA